MIGEAEFQKARNETARVVTAGTSTRVTRPGLYNSAATECNGPLRHIPATAQGSSVCPSLHGGTATLCSPLAVSLMCFCFSELAGGSPHCDQRLSLLCARYGLSTWLMWLVTMLKRSHFLPQLAAPHFSPCTRSLIVAFLRVQYPDGPTFLKPMVLSCT